MPIEQSQFDIIGSDIQSIGILHFLVIVLNIPPFLVQHFKSFVVHSILVLLFLVLQIVKSLVEHLFIVFDGHTFPPLAAGVVILYIVDWVPNVQSQSDILGVAIQSTGILQIFVFESKNYNW